MNVLTIFSIICFLVYLEVGLYVLVINPSAKLNRAFFYLAVSLAIWAFSFILLYSSQSKEVTYTWYKISGVGWGMSSFFMIWFLSHLTNFPKKDLNKKLLFGVFLIPSILFIYLVFSENWMLGSFIINQNYCYFAYDFQSTYFYLFFLFLISYCFFIVFILLQWYKRIKERNERIQFFIILTGLIITLLWIFIFDILSSVIFSKPLPLTSHIASIVHISGLAYTMLRFRLFTFSPEIIAHKVIDKLHEILIFFDTDTSILRINNHTEKFTGKRISKIYGKQLKSLFNSERVLNLEIKTALEKEESEPFDIQMISYGGSYIPVKINIFVIRDEFKDLLGFVAHGYDNKENLRLEKEIQIRKKAEEKLKNTGDILERLVRERNKELENSYKELQVKIAERMRVEELIKSDISEKEVLINEIHNRVIDNMNMIISLVNTQTPHNVTLKTFSKLQELNQRIKSMLLVHNNLYLSINYSDVDFANFLNVVINELLKFYRLEDKIIIKKHISNIFLNIDYAIPLGLVANELISNALIHSFPKSFLQKNKSLKPSIYINYTFENDCYCFIVSDNGKGLPKNFNIEKLKTSGLQLVEILVNEQIAGEWSIKSNEGVYIKITFRSEK